MSPLLKPIKWIYHEFGIASLYSTGRDAWLPILSRCFRILAYGANSLIIALFFPSLKFLDFQIGLFYSLTLAGDLLLSLGLTLVADALDRRCILLVSAVLMVLSGGVFAVFESF